MLCSYAQIVTQIHKKMKDGPKDDEQFTIKLKLYC